MSGADAVSPGDRQPGDLASASPQEPSGSHRLLHLLGALLVGVVLPAVLVGALVGELGVSALFTGVVWGAVGAKLAGTRRMVYVTISVLDRTHRPLIERSCQRPMPVVRHRGMVCAESLGPFSRPRRRP